MPLYSIILKFVRAKMFSLMATVQLISFRKFNIDAILLYNVLYIFPVLITPIMPFIKYFSF